MSVYKVIQFSVRFSYYSIMRRFIDFVNVGNHVKKSMEVVI